MIRNLIAREYLRTWFIVDFVSTVPLDTIFAKAVLNAGALRGTKLIRMIRLVRLFKIFRLLKVSGSYVLLLLLSWSSLLLLIIQRGLEGYLLPDKQRPWNL